MQVTSAVTLLHRRHVGNEQTSAAQLTWLFIYKSHDKEVDWLIWSVTLHYARFITLFDIGLNM